MEEPPSHVIFILATTEIQKVPATVLCPLPEIRFRPYHSPMIIRRTPRVMVAEQEQIELSTPAAELIGTAGRRRACGMRSRFSIPAPSAQREVDEALVRRMAGVTDKGYLFEFSQAITAQGFAPRAIQLVAELRHQLY